MARFGLLFLRQGQWRGSQVVPGDWVAESTASYSEAGESGGYGYLWWVVPGKAARPTFMASGFGGQFIWVYPPLDLVVATTSTVSPESGQRGQALHLIRNPVFAAVQRRVAGEPR